MTRLMQVVAIVWIVIFESAGVVVAQTPEPAPVWCQIDDPTSWNTARTKMIEDNQRDLTNVPCPDKFTGATLPRDLTLPMPCGRAMVFQRIDVPVGHVLDQIEGNFGRSVDIASETPQTVLSNGPWVGPVAGIFSLGADGNALTSESVATTTVRAYYAARYELTEPQWKLFELGLLDLSPEDTKNADAPACAPFQAWVGEQSLRTINPAGGLSWFDAVAVSRAYSSWLIALDNALIALGKPPTLPWEQGATGYVRLPTEAEWEYAARGGAAYTTPQGRSLKLPQVKDAASGVLRDARLNDVCADAPRGDGVPLSPIGQNLPNAFNLFDVVCNAEEIVLDLFRPTRPDGLAGPVGGVITKGGSSVLFRENNTVGRRSEAQALFTLSGEGSTPTMGTRLAISAPFFVGRRNADDTFVEGQSNAPFEDALVSARQVLLDSGVGLSRNDGEDLEAEINKLQRAISERELTQSELEERVGQLQIEIDRMNVALRKKAVESVRQSIRSAIVTGNMIDRVGKNIFAGMRLTQVQLDKPNKNAAVQTAIAGAIEGFGKNEQRIQAAFDLYLQVHAELAQADRAFVDLQIREARRGLSGSSVEVFEEYLTHFEQHYRAVRAARGQITEEIRTRWLFELDSERQARIDRFPDLQP